jgi:hypothetical protein
VWKREVECLSDVINKNYQYETPYLS